MLKKTFVTALCVACLTLSPLSMAEENTSMNFQILKEKIEADKKVVVAGNMQLTDDEARVFWPVYDEYQAELLKLNKRLSKVILDYADAYNQGPVTDEKAKQLLTAYLDIKKAKIKMKQRFADKLYKTVPAAKAVRYIQIENKIEAVQDFIMADGIPLVH